jgi:hypothetical protein
MKFQSDPQNSISFSLENALNLCAISAKKIVQIEGPERFLEKLLKDVLPEHNNIPESRHVW